MQPLIVSKDHYQLIRHISNPHYIRTVELQLSELMGTGTHSDNQIIRIIGVFLIKIAIGEKKKLRFDIALFFY